jgi:hypothetical protein
MGSFLSPAWFCSILIKNRSCIVGFKDCFVPMTKDKLGKEFITNQFEYWHLNEELYGGNDIDKA